LPPAFFWFLGLLFDPKDGKDTFLRSIGELLLNYKALQPYSHTEKVELNLRINFTVRDMLTSVVVLFKLY
jgi:hypothetical protein